MWSDRQNGMSDDDDDDDDDGDGDEEVTTSGALSELAEMAKRRLVMLTPH